MRFLKQNKQEKNKPKKKLGELWKLSSTQRYPKSLWKVVNNLSLFSEALWSVKTTTFKSVLGKLPSEI